ncbi:uncharacterized protein PAC_08175 [Phialocephala subalpina]|uniref:Uncharacterized protein n=1 Tax=Phialocephala subalpina TaxID=576137 RepID=A0A1L7WZU4_9HELO|nr:uncharacterized protein PAC_08175 [Phialocephala subalpina]
MANLNPTPNPQYSSSSSASYHSMSPSPFTYDSTSYQKLLSQRPKSPSPFHYDRPSIQRKLAQPRNSPSLASTTKTGFTTQTGTSLTAPKTSFANPKSPTMLPQPKDSPKHEHFPFEEPDRMMTIRLAPLRPALEALDKEYNEEKHPILDGNRMVGMGIVEAEVGEEELRFQEANDVLREHTRARLPYVQLAASRLQAVMGEKNELVFDLPNVDKPILSPQFKSVFDSEAGIGLGLGANLDAVRGKTMSVRKDSGVELGGGVEKMSTGEKLVEELKAIAKSKFTRSNWKAVDGKDESIDRAKMFGISKDAEINNNCDNSKSLDNSKPVDTSTSVYNTMSDGPKHVDISEPIDNTNSANNDNAQSFDSNLQSPPAQSGFFQIDPETGKGLREWLLKVSKENGTLKKKSCKSISFHDFTADMKTGAFSNVLVSHYNDEGPRQRVDAYEVDLPTPSYDNQTTTMQTWIWFLISRPILSFDPLAKPAPAKPTSDPRNWCDSPDIYYTSESYGHPLSSPREMKPPANFPDPIPVSWVVFACPLANVTVYPEQIEKSPSSSSDELSSTPEQVPTRLGHRKPSPAHPPAKRSNPFVGGREREKGKIIHKRLDYDISHQGLPIFEFSNSDADLFPLNPLFPGCYHHGQYLSVNSMPPFSLSPLPSSSTLSSDAIPNPFSETFHDDLLSRTAEFELKSKEDFRLDVGFWEHRGRNGVEGLGLSDEEIKRDEVECRRRQEEYPCPFWGEWWGLFYERIYEDEGRWRKVRKAMGRGKCRVVVRWVEFDGEAEGPRDGGMEKRGGGMGMGRGLLRGGSLGGGNVGGGGVQGRMRAVAHKRSRSALSVTVPPPLTTAYGIGVGRPINDGQGCLEQESEEPEDEESYWE